MRRVGRLLGLPSVACSPVAVSPHQDLVCDFIGGVAVAATQHAQLRTGVPKLGTEDVIAVVRKDAARLTRAKELVTANEETRKALKTAQPDNKDLAELGK